MLPSFNQLFNEFPDDSRVWLYLANRQLDATELLFAEGILMEFILTWKAHGKNLKCNGQILFSQYLILSVNENYESASGCSIDSSVRFVKSLGNELNVDFFNRLNVLSVIGENETKISNFFEASKGTVPYLNPIIETLGELRSNWIIMPN
jgi:hypothetical protein